MNQKRPTWLNQMVEANTRLLRNSLRDQVVTGFELDPLLSGLYLLGEKLRPASV